jgi:CRISPR-associated protein Cmr4
MGAGQSVSYVDLPVQRERHTSFPVLWSSGIKGVIRDLAMRYWESEYRKHGKTPEEAHKLAKDKVETIFGPEDGSSDFASCISITDAKILLYPVRSVKGVFAWITCPFVLKRFKEDLNAVGEEFKHNNQEIQIPDVSDDKVFIASDNLKIQGQNSVALEEFVFEAEVKNEVKELAGFLKSFVYQNDLTKNLGNHLAIVSDNVFRDFVNYAVEIRTRIKIDQALGTVDKKRGGLFSEELIPSESVFYSILFFKDSFKPNFKIDAESIFSEINSLLSKNSLLQLGGDETTGKGYVRVKFNEGNKQSSGQSVNHQQSNVGKN